IVASTTRPLSHFTRNIAFGSASWTTPSNSSLSPLGSFRSRRSLMNTRHSSCLLAGTERLEDARGDFLDRADSVDPPENAELLVVGQKLGGHRPVCREARADDLLVVVRPVLEVSTRGRRVVLQVVNLSSAFIRA